MTYFKDCTTINEVKALYRQLAKQYHPDKGGDLQTMQAINNEYAFCIAKLAKGENLTAEQVEAEILNAEQYKNAINAIINLSGINIELCGGWLWISGNTYSYRNILKTNGFYFASTKKMWYFRSPEYATNNRQKHTIEEIRVKYGTQQINTSSYKSYQLN
jgi:hypothetical protein